MKKIYKALMLDLDGTTICNSSDALPSDRVIDAVKKAQQKLSVCIATGRPLWRAQPVLDALHISSPVILLDGSQILEGSTKKLLYECPLRKKDISEILTILEPYHDRLAIDEKKRSVDYSSSYKPSNVFNFLVKGLSMHEANTIIRNLSHIETVTTHKALSWKEGKVILNISHILATKQHAIFEAAKLLEIETHEIIGVGDGYNDFPLLMACGLKIAMGNAVSELKDIADYIAPNVEEDGVAHVIEKFIL
jgi:HAD superfamily hydrolase (TIGR01484 family)